MPGPKEVLAVTLIVWTEHGELTPRRINGRNRPNDAVLHVDAIGRALAL